MSLIFLVQADLNEQQRGIVHVIETSQHDTVYLSTVRELFMEHLASDD